MHFTPTDRYSRVEKHSRQAPIKIEGENWNFGDPLELDKQTKSEKNKYRSKDKTRHQTNNHQSIKIKIKINKQFPQTSRLNNNLQVKIKWGNIFQ